MPDFVQLLHSIGLNESEAKVYLTNLEVGSAPAQVLVKRSGFSRPATYDAIDQLMQKGLITATLRGKRKVYTAEAPEKLLSYGQIQVQGLQSKVEKISSLMDDLKFLQHGDRPLVKFYEGLDGLKMILKDVADSNPESTEEITNVDSVHQVLSDEELESLQTYLSKMKSKGRGLLAGKVSVVRPGAEARILPKEFNFHGDFIGYGNKLAMITFKGKLIGAVIESSVIADTYRALFELAWRGAKEFTLMDDEGSHPSSTTK